MNFVMGQYKKPKKIDFVVTKEAADSFVNQFHQKKAADEFQSLYNDWSKEATAYQNNYAKRFGVKDYGKSYVADSADAYTSAKTAYDSLLGKTQQMQQLMKQYGSYWKQNGLVTDGEDGFSALTKHISNSMNNFSKMQSAYQQDNDYWSQFDSEEAYNVWATNNEKRRRYDAMSVDELKKYQAKQKASQPTMVNPTDIEDPSNSSYDEVLYNDENGMAVTLNTLIRTKSMEDKLSAIKGNQATNDPYSSLVTTKEDLDIIDKVLYTVQMGNSNANAFTGTDSIVTDEDRQRFDYISQKYGVDFSKGLADVEQDLKSLQDTKYSEKKSDSELLAEQGYSWDEINRYMDWMSDKEAYAEKMKEHAQFGKDHPIGATILNILAAPTQIIDYAGNIVDTARATGTDEDSFMRVPNVYDDSNVNAIQASSGAVSNLVGEKVLEKTGNQYLSWLSSTAYSGVTSALQSATTIGASVALFGPQAGSVIGRGVMASQAAAQQFNQSVRNGSTNGEALAMSIAAGTAEYLWDKIPVDNMLKNIGGWDVSSVTAFLNSLQNGVKGTLFQGLSEALEETGTSFTNFIADGIINGDHSEYKNSIRKYEEMGLSQDEAQSKAGKEFLTSLLGDAIGGFIGGFAHSGVTNTYQSVKGAFAVKQNNKSAGERVISQGKVDVLKKLATDLYKDNPNEDTARFLKMAEKADIRNPNRVGELYTEIQHTFKQQSRNEIKDSLVDQGMAVKKADEVATWLNDSVYSGKEFTDSQTKELEKDEMIAKTHQELILNPNSTVWQHRMMLDSVFSGASDTVTEAQNEAQSVFDGNPTTASPENQMPSTGQYQASVDGVAKVDGNQVQIIGLSPQNSNIVRYRDSNGTVQEVDANKVQFASEKQAIIAEFLPKLDISGSVLNTVVDSVMDGQSPAEYILDFAQIYHCGKNGYNFSDVTALEEYKRLYLEQARLAYDLGKAAKQTGSEKQELKKKNPHTADEKEKVLAIGRKLGRRIVFEDIPPLKNGAVPDGYIETKSRVIHINNSTERPLAFVLKHELTHFLEEHAKYYNDFANEVMDSKVFKQWMSSKGYSSLVSYRTQIMSDYSGIETFDEKAANEEIFANFVGENLFGSETEITEKLIKALEPKQRRTLGQVIADFFRRLKYVVSGHKPLQSPLEKFENDFIKAYQNVQKEVANGKSTDQSEKVDENKSFSLTKKDSNQNRANKEGDLANEYRDVLTSEEWVRFYNTIKEQNKLNSPIGDRLAFSSKNRIIIAERVWINDRSHDYRVIDAYEIDTGNIYKDTTFAYELMRILEEGAVEYDRTRVFKQFVKLIKSNGEHGVFRVYDRQHLEFVDRFVSEGSQRKRSYEIFRGTGKETAGRNLSKRDQQNSSGINGEIDKKYSIPTETADDLLTQFQNGKISREEFLSKVSKPNSTMNPVQIANMKPEQSNTTPQLQPKEGKSQGYSTSKFAESIQDSKLFDETFKQMAKTDSFIEKYQSIANKETMRKALKELDIGGEEYVKEWFIKPIDKTTLTDRAVGFILLTRYQQIGDYKSAMAVAEKVREMGTVSGQQVQIFSILDRFDPNMMQAYAKKELTTAFEKMKIGKTKKWIDENKERFLLTDDDVEFIRRRTLQASVLPEGRDKAILLAEIASRIQEKLPPEKGQALKAYQRISMLLNAKTNIRNITGNAGMVPIFILSDYFSAPMDKWVSTKTNYRAKGGFHLEGRGQAFAKGLFETFDDFKRHINTRNAEMNRFEIGKSKSFNEHHQGALAKQRNDIAKMLNSLDRFTSFLLEVGDRPFYEMWFVNSINNQMKLNNVSEPTLEMVEIATQEALQRTWQDSNKMTKAVSKMKDVANIVSIGGYGLGDVIVKFTKTPANLTKAIVDFSPAGLVKSLTADGLRLKNAIETGQFEPKLQHKFVDSFGKGVAGTILYVALYALASTGRLTGKSDEDDDVAAFERYIQGVPDYSVKLFGKWFSYDWMQPIGSVAAIVSDYMDNKKQNPENEVTENIVSAIRTGGDVLYNQSFMKGFQALFTADSFMDGFLDVLLSDPSVLVPQVVSQVANITDPYKRVTYEADKPMKSAVNGVIAKIPGLRNTLEKDVDILGREIPNAQHNWFNAFFNPGNTYMDTSNAVSDEVYRIYQSTGDRGVIPPKAPSSVTVKNIKQVMSTEQKTEYQRVAGQTANEIIGELINSADYKALTDEEKGGLIKEALAYATAKGKSSLTYSYDTVNAILEGTLTESEYKSMSEQQKKLITDEYLLSDFSEYANLSNAEIGEIILQATGETYRVRSVNYALASGNYDSAKRMIEQIVDGKVNDYEPQTAKVRKSLRQRKEDAENSIKKSIENYWKLRYQNAWKANNSYEMERIRKMLVNTGLYTSGEANSTGRKWIQSLCNN